MNALLVKTFGGDALPTEEMLRGFNDALTSAEEKLARSTIRAKARITESLATIRELEALFKEQNDEDLEAFAKAMAERMRSGRKEKRS